MRDTTLIRIPATLLRRLKIQAATEGRTMLDLLTEIIEADLKVRIKKGN